uniref:Uncharacterized protein n=1 Tax=Oryza glumipatula TaxID=40148 RepID=A0A0D9YE04_9ORYZ
MLYKELRWHMERSKPVVKDVKRLKSSALNGNSSGHSTFFKIYKQRAVIDISRPHTRSQGEKIAINGLWNTTCSTGETPCLGRAEATNERDGAPPEAMRASWSTKAAPRPRKTRRGRAACGATGAPRARGAEARARGVLRRGLLRARSSWGRGASVAMEVGGGRGG